MFLTQIKQLKLIANKLSILKLKGLNKINGFTFEVLTKYSL